MELFMYIYDNFAVVTSFPKQHCGLGAWKAISETQRQFFLQIWIIHLREQIINFCMSPPMDGNLPGTVILSTRDQLSIDSSSIKLNHKCTLNHLSPIGKIFVHEKCNFVKFVFSSIRLLYCCDITYCIAECHLRGRQTRN